MIGIMIRILILVLEVVWIGTMVRRLPKDIREFREATDYRDRIVDIFLWLVTVAFIVHLGLFVWFLVKPTLKFFYPNL